MAQAANGSQGTARNAPSGGSGQSGSSAKGNYASGAVAGTNGARGSSFSPTVHGRGSSGAGMMSTGARAVAGRNMAGVSIGSSQASSGASGPARTGPSGGAGQGRYTARAVSARSMVTGTGMAGPSRPTYTAFRASSPSVRNSVTGTASYTPPSPAAPTTPSRSRLGSTTPNLSNQVMTQADSSAMMSRPVGMRGLRSRPRAYAERPEEPSLTARPIQMASASQSPRASSRLAPSINRSVEPRVPSVRDVPSTSPTQPLVQVTPPPSPERLVQPPVRPQPQIQTATNPLLAETQPETAEAEENQTPLEVFRTRGFEATAEGKGDDYVFIIDKSKSMKDDRRLIAAKEALARTLEKLEPNKRFYIFFFSDDTIGMKEGRLLKATPANVEYTQRWVGRMSPEGFTNPRDALSEAFGKLKPSTIWLLSDGKFSQFKRVKRGNRTQVVGLPPVYKVIQKLNPTGAVRVNTIGFADSEQDVDDSLKAIAKENDGTYRFIKSNER